MLKFLALQSKGSLILKPVSWGFVFCGIKSEQKPLAGNAQRFSYIEATLLCLPTEKLEPKTNKAEKSVKDKQVDKTEKSKKCKDVLSVPEGRTQWKGIQIQGNTFWGPKPGSRLKTVANKLSFN